MTDYVARLHCEIRQEPTGSRFFVASRQTVFPAVAPAALRDVVNGAMAFVAGRFGANVAARGVEMATRQIEEAALEVVVYWLYTYNMWRSTYPAHRDHPLSVSQSDLDHPASFDKVWTYCKQAFGVDYARHAAALLGLSVEAFAKREAERELFWHK